jgi:hypothetical protein
LTKLSDTWYTLEHKQQGERYTSLHTPSLLFVVVALSLRKNALHTGGLVMQGRIWLFSAVLACLVAAQAIAQDNGEYLPKAGDFRIGFSTQGGSGIAYSDLEGVKTTNIVLGGSVFFSSNFSLDLGVGYTESKFEGESTKATAWSAGVSLYFGSGGTTNFVPFVNVSYASIDFDGSDLTGFRASIGGHLFLTENASLDIGISYANLRGGGEKADGFGVAVGFSLWFR